MDIEFWIIVGAISLVGFGTLAYAVHLGNEIREEERRMREAESGGIPKGQSAGA